VLAGLSCTVEYDKCSAAIQAMAMLYCTVLHCAVLYCTMLTLHSTVFFCTCHFMRFTVQDALQGAAQDTSFFDRSSDPDQKDRK
jgi:hypothetical protein